MSVVERPCEVDASSETSEPGKIRRPSADAECSASSEALTLLGPFCS